MPPGRRARIFLALSMVLICGNGGLNLAMASEPDPEVSVCGALREPLAFWLFRRAAGNTDAGRVAGIPDIERIAFTTRDGRRLGGYRLRAAVSTGYLLVAPGNAMLADQLVGELQYFRERGFDVYVYDYRGYGLSEGKSRLNAIVSDYREIVARLNALGHPRRMLYGISMGGVILLNAVGASGDYSALVIDSSPSRIAPYGCPKTYDPVDHLPADSSRIMVIAGERDRVVPPAEIEELLRVAKSRGAQVLVHREFAHPFQDATDDIHRHRFQTVADFLLR